jgi:formylglycine-generating enzyme
VACTRGTPSEQVGTASLQIGTMIAAPVATIDPASATSATSGGAAAKNDACPTGMVLVEGEYCPEVEQNCLEWMDPPTSRYAHFRCKRYAKPAVCRVPKVHRRYCIDATERVEEGTKLPRHFMSWTSSKALCESEGARLCRESEWIFACEGEEMRPYPYG